MTNVSRDDVVKLAALSSLQLADEEIDGLEKDISNILDYIEKLSQLDTSGVEPTYQVTDLENVGRDDDVQLHDADRDALLKLAPVTDNNSVKVPKVL